jgi:O-acetyl-ADP-ribose deacetylase (regulator of RNase III)
MPFQIIRNDITKVKADAIVNTANPDPIVGGGTDSAIYAAAGEKELLAERQKIGEIQPGQAVSTDAFRLQAKYIIHTVGPSWIDGQHGEREILHACYENSLSLADKLKCQSIAFPLIATGVYQFPKDEALQIALSEINKFLLSHEMEVILVVFDQKAFELSTKLSGSIQEFIDENSVQSLRKMEYGAPLYSGDSQESRRELRRRQQNKFLEEHADEILASDRMEEPDVTVIPEDLSGKSLEDLVGSLEKTFQERLFELINERGIDEVSVYKKANIDRKLFSRIRSKKDYKPKKKTAVALAIALGLDLPTMKDLLGRAGFALSPSSKADLIIMYFVSRQDYNIYEINAALFDYGQPLLGQ